MVAGAACLPCATDHTWCPGPDQVISSDRLRPVVGAGERDQRASADAFELLELIVEKRCRRRLTTVVDTTGLEPRRRARWRALAEGRGVPVHAVVVDPGAKVMRERNRARGMTVPSKVISGQLRAVEEVLEQLAVGREWEDMLESYTTLDVLSGGRAICGLGAAWFEREHELYGWGFPSRAERYARLEDALELLPLMWGPGAPRFEGRTITVAEAACYPRPLQERIPILVGGSGDRKALRLVARHADACNVFGDPDTVRHKVAVLHEHCAAEGRDPAAVRVTQLAAARVIGADEERTGPGAATTQEPSGRRSTSVAPDQPRALSQARALIGRGASARARRARHARARRRARSRSSPGRARMRASRPACVRARPAPRAPPTLRAGARGRRRWPHRGPPRPERPRSLARRRHRGAGP
jgi:alkanesulfonate monooxygenase SsuD/methylene tetrahydromethanopterin reductase-like flavin-dependent oxidoreductase (luciferase family)/predicted kinase